MNLLSRIFWPVPAQTLAATENPVPLRTFFCVLLLMLLAAGVYILRNRKKFFGYAGDPHDSYASANLRMWLIVLVWLHAVVLTVVMIFEV